MVSAGVTVETDERLVVAAREGSDEAFEALFRRHRDRITNIDVVEKLDALGHLAIAHVEAGDDAFGEHPNPRPLP